MDLKINIAADVAAAVAHLDKTRAALSDLSDQSDLSDKNFKVTAQTQPAVNNLSKLERAAQSAVATLGKVTRTIGRTAAAGGTWLAVKSVNALKWGFAGLTAGVGAGAFALTKYGAAAEQTRLAFRTMLGSIADGDARMAKLDRFSNSTPYSGDQVNQAAKTLLAFGVEAGDVEETLRSVGDVASGSGKDFNELAAIYGKVFAKGKMDTEAMNQMVEAGIPIVKTLGTMFGKSGNQIYEMAEKGEISAAAVDRAFKQMSGSGGVFAGMMEKQSNTLSGIWGAITGQLAYAAQNIGEAIVPALKVVMSYLQTWADKIAEMSADGSLLKYFGSIATAGVTAIGEIIKWSVTLANHFAAAFKTIGAWGEMLWNGLETGLLGLVTLWVAEFEAVVNAALAAYNTVVRFFGGKGKEINWTWTKVTAETTADSGRKTADAYHRATDGSYFAEAMIDNSKFDNAVNSAVSSINTRISSAVDKAAETQRQRTKDIDKTLKKGKPNYDVRTGGKNKTVERSPLDQWAKLGLFNFGRNNVRSLDVERNNLLKKVLAKKTVEFVVNEV